MKSLFSRKTQVGAAANDLFLDHIAARDFNKSAALNSVRQVLGDDILKNKDAHREIVLAIDAMNGQAIQNMATLNPIDEAADAGLLERVLSKVVAKNDFDEHDVAAIGSIISQRLDMGGDTVGGMSMVAPFENLMRNADVPEPVKQGVARVMSHMDRLNAQEAEAGLSHGFQPYYILHSYLQSARAEGVAGNVGKAADFLKARKFNTVRDAFLQGMGQGRLLVSDTSLPDLLYKREVASRNMLSGYDFARRLSLESSIAPSQLSKLVQEASLDPQGPAAQLLKKNKIKVHEIDPELIAKGYENSKILDMYSDVAAGGAYNRAALQSAVDFSSDLEDGIKMAGELPADWKMPKAEFGELGRKVKYGKQEVWLPPVLANAFDDVTKSRDYIKELAGTSAFGQKTLATIDGIQSTFKSALTKFFPAFYGQNMISDRVAQLARGWSHYEPGLINEAYNVLKGKGTITTPSGIRWDADSITRAAKQFGLTPDANTIFDYMDAASKIDVDKYLKAQQGVGKNVKQGNLLVAFDQSVNAFTKYSDHMFRVAEFMHNLKKGHTPAIAAQRANEVYVNYKDLTAFEKSFAQRFFLFYNFMSKQTKLAMTDFITGPKYVQGQMRATRALSEMFSAPNAEPTWEDKDRELLLSRAALDTITLPMGKDKEGKTIYGRGFNAPLNAALQQFALFSPRSLDVAELAGAAQDSITRTVQKAFASSNPIINSTAQLLTGKNLYFDKPLNAEFLRKMPKLESVAAALAPYPFDKIPKSVASTIDKTILEGVLKGVEDGKGHYIVDPGWMWLLTNIVPGFSRAVSTANVVAYPTLTTGQKLAKTGASVGIETQDLSKSGMFALNAELDRILVEQAIRTRERNLKQQ